MRSIPEQVWPAFANPPQTRAGDRVGEVGVGADDLRVLAAELEHRALEVAGADLADVAAHLDRAREEDLRDAVDSQSASPIRAAAVDDPDQALGMPARSNTSRIRSPSSGVRLAGFSTTPLPAISAIATSSKGIDHG